MKRILYAKYWTLYWVLWPARAMYPKLHGAAYDLKMKKLATWFWNKYLRTMERQLSYAAKQMELVL